MRSARWCPAFVVVLLLFVACGSSDDEAKQRANDACAAIGGRCFDPHDASGCTGKAYPYCLPPPEGYCVWLGGQEVGSICLGRETCCVPKAADGGADADAEAGTDADANTDAGADADAQ